MLAAVGGLALTGGAGYVAVDGLGGGGGDRVTVDTIDAQGSSAGRQRLPVPGQATLIDLFATWCVPCEAQMRSLLDVHGDFADRVAFVSVTNERIGGGLTMDDVRDWWADHDGRWTVGHDPESRLMSTLGAGGLPFLALADASGEVVWTHRGVAGPGTLREELAAVA
jgi:thiol-disulfide isomerase/thioredoxin